MTHAELMEKACEIDENRRWLVSHVFFDGQEHTTAQPVTGWYEVAVSQWEMVGQYSRRWSLWEKIN